MKRKQQKNIDKWLETPNRKPLIIRGARQVGKTTLVELFAQEMKRPLANINLERHLNLATIFKQNDPEKLINVLEALPNINEIGRNDLLFFDEIQAIPDAIPALRYLYEDMPELAVLAAGSLLEFMLSDHQFSMPVGRVEYLHMGPMTFTEFLGALSETKLKSIIENFTFDGVIDPVVHQRLLELLKTYCFVGGMPEAVKAYVRRKRLREVTGIHRSIIETYQEDFPKYVGSRNLDRIQHVFDFVARNIGNKVKYSHFSRSHQSALIKSDIELLCMARVISKVTHSHCTGIPLQAELKDNVYKLIFLDVGLMNCVCGLDWGTIAHVDDIQLVNHGAIAEQFIGQHLQDMLANRASRKLTYWLREGRSNNAEVDYVVAEQNNLLPIEVKSGSRGSLKSLHQFMGEKKLPVALRFDSNLPSMQKVNTSFRKSGQQHKVSYDLISLPLYLVERFGSVVREYKSFEV